MLLSSVDRSFQFLDQTDNQIPKYTYRMNHKDILSRMLVIIVLGPDRLTEEICHGLDGCQGIQLIQIRNILENRKRLGLPDSDSIELFLEHASNAFHREKRMLVVTGFPKNAEDAQKVFECCPHLRTLSLEGPPEYFYHRALTFNLDGLTREEFMKARNAEEAAVPQIKRILGQENDVTVIYSMRSLSKKQTFLRNRIEEFRTGVMIDIAAYKARKVPMSSIPGAVLVPA